MACTVDNKDIERIRSAKASVLSWFNSNRLIWVSKNLLALREDANIVREVNLSKLDEVSRNQRWKDMCKMFEYRFGEKL